MIKPKGLLKEESAPISKLLKSVVDGDTTVLSTKIVNGVKFEKNSTVNLLKIYNLLDASGHRNFDKISADKLVNVFSNLI